MGKPLALLQIEDNEDDALLVALALGRAGYDVTAARVETPSALEDALRRSDWDIVVSDYSLPGFSGMDALKIVRSVGGQLPFIIVSGAIGEETAVELMRSGAQDCIMKDKLSRLPPAVAREIGEAQMRRERLEALKSLRRELRLNASLAELSRHLIAMPGGLIPVADRVLECAKELTGSRHGYVGVIDPRTGALRPLTFSRMLEGQCRIGADEKAVTFPRGPGGRYGGLWGFALNTKEPFFDNAPASHPEAVGLPEGHIPIERFLSVPVLSGEKLLGQISVANPDRDYAMEDRTAIGRLADLFSIAVTTHNNQMETDHLAAQVRQMQKMEAIGTLAGGIAHDFNNILTPMIGYAELVKMCLSKDSKTWRHQEEVLKACSRARDLVRQILTLSRQTEEERTPMPLHPIVKEALRLLRSSLPATIEIRQRIDADCGPVLAVPTHIHQIVMNLCTNAYHAMREKGGVLDVSMTPLHIDPWDMGLGMEPGDYVKLEVGDTGHGMDRDTLEKIFDPYFTTKKTGEGTGLGLSIVQSIVRKYGGRISVYSEPGLGTTFHVYLPVAADLNRAVEAQAPGSAVISGEERILLVDDVGEIVDMAKEMLERMGYRVTGHTSSTAALEDFSRDPSGFDLVITDLTMPNLTGVELSRKLVEIRHDIPIILCSGLGESIDEKTLAASGIRRYLKKPVMFRDYGEAVRQVLDGAKAASRPPGEAA